MAMDNRLDFITKIAPEYIEAMTKLRKQFIELDNELKVIADDLEARQLPAGLRTIALSRTHLETALQFGIKSLCIAGEVNG